MHSRNLNSNNNKQHFSVDEGRASNNMQIGEGKKERTHSDTNNKTKRGNNLPMTENASSQLLVLTTSQEIRFPLTT